MELCDHLSIACHSTILNNFFLYRSTPYLTLLNRIPIFTGVYTHSEVAVLTATTARTVPTVEPHDPTIGPAARVYTLYDRSRLYCTLYYVRYVNILYDHSRLSYASVIHATMYTAL